MEKFCVITNSSKESVKETAREIQTFLENRGKKCIVTKDHPDRPEKYTDVSEIPLDTECAIVLGGDGTLIQAAVDLKDRNLSLVGVNLGKLGFLTEVEKSGLTTALHRLVEGPVKIEHRMMLKGKVKCRDGNEYTDYGLNDIVLFRTGFHSLITVQVFCNGALLDTFTGDGVLVCTPTGATGYNLAAGGPVVAPESRLFTITPICPHSLNKRSFVVPGEDRIKLILCPWRQEGEEAILSFDSRLHNPIRTGDEVEIIRAEEETRLIKLTDLSFFDILRNKLNK